MFTHAGENRREQCSKWKFMSASILIKSGTRLSRREKLKQRKTAIDKYRYEIQEYKQVPVWYTGI
jgi:hypothetical protein